MLTSFLVFVEFTCRVSLWALSCAVCALGRYRDFADWWPQFSPKTLDGCGRVGQRLVAHQLHWQVRGLVVKC